MKGEGTISVILTLVIMSLVILVGVAIFLVLKDIEEKTEEDADCIAQIRAHAAAVRFTAELKAPTIACPTKQDTVTSEYNRTIADAMVSCWDMWGRGELQLFGRADGLYCHVCSMISVDRDVQDFPAFLDTNRYHGGLFYSQHLMGLERGTYFDDKTFPNIGQDPFNAEKPIGVLFYYAQGASSIEKLARHVFTPQVAVPGGALAGAAGGGLVAAGIISLTGVGLPVAIAIGSVSVAGGAALGGYTGLLASLGVDEIDSLSIVVARSLDDDMITQLGCTYAPVSN